MAEHGKDVVSEDMQELTHGKEDVSNKASGHKANIANPNTSEKSKQNSREELERLGGEQAFYGKQGETTTKSAEENLEGTRAAR